MFTTNKTSPRIISLFAFATGLFVLSAGPSAAAQTACADSIQGRIAWAGGKSLRFVTELDPEVEPRAPPAPITGRRQLRDGGDRVIP